MLCGMEHCDEPVVTGQDSQSLLDYKSTMCVEFMKAAKTAGSASASRTRLHLFLSNSLAEWGGMLIFAVTQQNDGRIWQSRPDYTP